MQAHYAGGTDAFVTKISAVPEMNIETTSARVLVRWPAPTPEFCLEAAEDFAGPWHMVTDKPVVAGGWNTVELPASTPCRFFRLKCP